MRTGRAADELGKVSGALKAKAVHGLKVNVKGTCTEAALRHIGAHAAFCACSMANYAYSAHATFCTCTMAYNYAYSEHAAFCACTMAHKQTKAEFFSSRLIGS